MRGKSLGAWARLSIALCAVLVFGLSAMAGQAGAGHPACTPDAGACCAANGTPGCDDPTCCNAVCAFDLFCCAVTWDDICAAEALATCDACGAVAGACCLIDGTCLDVTETDCSAAGGVFQGVGTDCAGVKCPPANPCTPDAGSCCVANGTPGCDDPECCNAICAFDPFCCEMMWDELCRAEALGTCDACGAAAGACCFLDGTCLDDTEATCDAAGGLFQGGGTNCAGVKCPTANDDCVDSIPIQNGMTPFSTLGATTDGPAACGFLASDIWYDYTADFNGQLVVETCGSDFDTVVAVYDGCDCPGALAVPLACNDDFCGVQSQAVAPVIAGSCYKVQVGGFGGGVQGSGIITISKIEATGACCLADGSCGELTEPDCLAVGGTFFGNQICGGAQTFVIEACANAFEDISATGTELFLADDGGVVVDLGFTFTFFGDPHSQIGVSANGYLTFGNDLMDFTNLAIPDVADPNDAIFPFWDDLNPSQGGTIHHQTLGPPGDRRFIAQWTAVPEFFNTGSNTFQAVLFEADNCIEFRYGEFTADLSGPDVTIGVENQDGTDGLAVDTTTIAPGSCVSMCPVQLVFSCCPWDLNGDDLVNILDLIELMLSLGSCIGCPADFDGDAEVDVLDLVALLSNLGECPGFTACPWDIDGDGDVGTQDLQSVLENLGPCPAPPAECPWDFDGDGDVGDPDIIGLMNNWGPCL